MKITKLFTLALAAFAFAACSQDDNVTENMRKANITLHAPEFDADWSRAQGSAPGKGFRIKHELDEKTGMKFSWTQGDKAGVFAENSKQQLPLKMAEGQDAAAKVDFVREDYELKVGVNYVAYYPVVNILDQEPSIEVSYKDQEQDGNHSYDHLAKYDYMVSNPVTVQQTNTADFKFNHQGAILRLLIDMPEGTYSSLKLSANYENGNSASIFTTKAVLNLFDKTEVIQKAATSNVMKLTFKENITITESDNQLEAWLMVSPVDFTTNKLTVYVYDAAGKEAASYTICPGKKFEKGKAYQIKLPGDAVDHSKNPLLKWAEYNLKYNKKTGESEFEETNAARGCLYQWGRNYGWTDYQDAMGTYDYTTKTWDYYVGNYNVYVHSGTGKYYVSNDDIECPSVYGYSTQADIKEMTNKWLMNSNSTSSNNGDYWFWTGGGNNWSERAKLVGYETETPCPAGWRLPTVADFKEIMPSNSISTSNSLATALNNLVELKEIEGVCKYAIKWSMYTKDTTKGIMIQALVVPSTFTKSDLASVDWNNNKVVTRYFPFSGAIRSTVTSYSPSNSYAYDFILDVVAAPMPIGDILFTGNNEYYNRWTRIWWATWNVLTDFTNNYGAYWASDSKQTFTFVDNSGWNGQTTQFKMTTQNAHNAYAIRCVKAE